MDRDIKIAFELIYQLIVDLQNRDLNLSVKQVLPLISQYFHEHD